MKSTLLRSRFFTIRVITEIEVHCYPRIVDHIGHENFAQKDFGFYVCISRFITLVLLVDKGCVRVWNKSLDLVQWL